MTHVLMLFLDGVGIGSKNHRRNPFFTAKMNTLLGLLGGNMPHKRHARYSSSLASLVPLNATMGVSGLPQSGTGQTALLTGRNAAKIVGRHFGPYPHSSLKPVIKEQNIFRKLELAGRSSFYANAFPRQFSEYLESRKTRITAITMSWLMAGNALNDHVALSSGSALSADITNERWHDLGYPDLAIISPQEAGRRLVDLTMKHDFVFYEYFLTDHAGHSRSMQQATDFLEKFDGLLEGIMDAFNHESMSLVLTSDHGNIEDISTKSHTRNPVPFLAVGAHHRELTAEMNDLTHVAPALLKLFS